MKVVTHIVGLTLLAAVLSPVAETAIGREILPPDPENPGTCPICNGIRVKSGSIWYPSGCSVAQCTGEGTNMIIHYTSCGSVGAAPPCSVHRDSTKVFPDCCPKIRCPKRLG